MPIMHGFTPLETAGIAAIIDSVGPSAALHPSSPPSSRDSGSEGGDNDEDDNESDTEDPLKFSEDMVVCPQADGDEKVMLIMDYLGNEWEEMITDLRSVQPVPQPDFLTIPLHDYQLYGIAKLGHVLLKGPLDGVILGDSMGLGKTIQSLTICHLLRDWPGCYNLIVTTQSSAPQFKQEILSRFKKDCCPSVLLVKGPKDVPAANDLIAGRWDFVVISYDRLYAHYKGVETARENGQKVKASFYSDLFDLSKKTIRFLVIDEVTTNILRTTGKKHTAIKALNYRKALLLSGTFVPDKWYEVYDVLDLMPRAHGFPSREIFRANFYPGGRGRPSMSGPYADRLVRFLLPNVVARPSDVLKIPPHEFETLWYVLDKNAECQVLLAVKKFLAACHNAKLDVSVAVSKASGEEETKEPVMGHAQRAQLLSSSVLFARYKDGKLQPRASSSSKNKLQTIHRCARDYGLLDGQEEADMSKDDKVKLIEKLVRTLAKRQKPKSKPKFVGILHSNSDSDSEDAEEKEEDDTDGEDTASVDEAVNNRQQWLDWVLDISNEDLYSPKIELILDKIEMEAQKQTGKRRKIIIFSKFLKLLDLISEAVKRRFNAQPFLFHGALNMDQRESIIRDFSAAEETTRPMLMTQQSGGAALNITAANVVIICEPWWCDNEVKQAIARCVRQGQENAVLISHVMGINSAIDFTVTVTRFRKQGDVDEIMSMIRISDTAKLVIPQLPVPSQPIAEDADDDCE